MSFRDQSWEHRFSKMGDEAEGRFEAWAERKGLGFVRFGLDRPPIAMHMLPARVRYTPDYLMSKCFVECQGFGRDQTFKMKLDKANCLHYWSDLHPTYIYVWDSTNEREGFLHILDFDRVLGVAGAELRLFAEGKPYYAVSAEAIFEAASDAPKA